MRRKRRRALCAEQVPEMLRVGWKLLCAALCSLLLGRAEAPSPGVPPEQSRPYAVLRGQNLGERRGRVCSQTRARGVCAGRGRRRAVRGTGPGPLVLAKLLFLLSAPGLGAIARTLCAGGTCWSGKPETWVCALLSRSVDSGQAAGLILHPSSFELSRFSAMAFVIDRF